MATALIGALKEGTTRLSRQWRDWRWFTFTLALLLLVRSVAADWHQVPTGSMQPTIAVGDQIVVDKRAYGLRLPFTTFHLAQWEDPERGDIVTFPSPISDQLYVKRVVAKPGDEVQIRGHELTINGARAQYRRPSDAELAQLEPPQIGTFYMVETLLGHSRLIQVPARPNKPVRLHVFFVPEDRYFLLGDNRYDSLDSRVYGTVGRSQMLGRATSVAFSLDYEDTFRPRANRSFIALN